MLQEVGFCQGRAPRDATEIRRAGLTSSLRGRKKILEGAQAPQKMAETLSELLSYLAQLPADADTHLVTLVGPERPDLPPSALPLQPLRSWGELLASTVLRKGRHC